MDIAFEYLITILLSPTFFPCEFVKKASSLCREQLPLISSKSMETREKVRRREGGAKKTTRIALALTLVRTDYQPGSKFEKKNLT